MKSEKECSQSADIRLNKSKICLLLFIVGCFIISVGVIFMIVAITSSEGQADSVIIIFLGPFPIVIGAGSELIWVVLCVMLLAILSIVLFSMLRRKWIS